MNLLELIKTLETLGDFIIILLPFIYFAPTILAAEYGVCTFGFIINNLIFGRTPIPRTILIIKALKNKNLILEERQLKRRYSKEELNKLRSNKSPVRPNN